MAGMAALPKDLLLTPKAWSFSDRGGPKAADVVATGSPESLAYLLGFIGARVEIYNQYADCVWWGVFWEVTVRLGNITVYLNLDNIFNRVKVLYTVDALDGTITSTETEWAFDQDSIDRYGVRELVYGLPDNLNAAPELMRSRLLNRYRDPNPLVGIVSGIPTYAAQMSCKGDWERSNDIYFTNPKGFHSFELENSTQSIGMFIDSNQIYFTVDSDPGPGFYEDLLQRGDGNLDLQVDDDIFISGAGMIDVDPGPGEDFQTNDGQFKIELIVAANTVQVVSAFINQDPGPMIRISKGTQISYGFIGQGFKTTTSWAATHASLRVSRIGSPGDNVRLDLCTNNSGVPGTMISRAEMVGSQLPTALSWVEFEFDNPASLSAGTTYWLVFYRTGASSLANGYQVAIDEEIDGVPPGYSPAGLKVYTGSAWVDRSPDADMPFRVAGEITTTAQMVEALNKLTDLTGEIMQVDSEIMMRQYSPDYHTVKSEVEDLLDQGTADGQRLMLWVTQDQHIVVGPPAPNSNSNLILGTDGRLRYPTGGEFTPGLPIFGRYIDVDSLVLLDAIRFRARRGNAIYVEESTYDADTDMLDIVSEGAPDPFRALTIRKG